MSLLDRIKVAESEAAVATLLQEGAGYLYASDKTRRRWQEAAKARLKALSNADEGDEA